MDVRRVAAIEGTARDRQSDTFKTRRQRTVRLATRQDLRATPADVSDLLSMEH